MEHFYHQLIKQLEVLYSLTQEEESLICRNRNTIKERFLYNCSHLRNKYYDSEDFLSPLHNCQFLMFLYFCANTIFRNEGRCNVCDKIYNLSKIVSSADIYYEIELPSIFMFDHPVGTVLGRAKYGDYFTFAQNCTVGNNKGIYPEFGNFVVMHANSMVLGNSIVGSNVIISANTYIKDVNIPDNSLVFNDCTHRNELVIKKLSNEKVKDFFEVRFKK